MSDVGIGVHVSGYAENSKQTTVDIIISTYNRGENIDATITSIRQNTYKEFKLWVLDQSDDDRTERCVLRHAAEDKRVNYARAPLAGISPTRNRGVWESTATYILFTNDDCQVEPGWVEALLDEFVTPDVWMVFGCVVPSKKSQDNADNVTVLAVKQSSQREVFQGNRLNLGFGHGHNMAVRRERFQELGGFDELLGSGGALGSWEERDLGYRALKQGGTIVYTPRALVIHNHWQNWQGVTRSYKNYGIGTGAAVAKYLRCGDPLAMLLLLEWMFSQGLRQALSGMLKWRQLGRFMAGLTQFVWPLVGVWRSMRYPLDKAHILYRRST